MWLGNNQGGEHSPSHLLLRLRMPRELLDAARGWAVRLCAKHGRGFICWVAAGRGGDELITMALLDTRVAPRGGYLKRGSSGSGVAPGRPPRGSLAHHAI